MFFAFQLIFRLIFVIIELQDLGGEYHELNHRINNQTDD